MCYPTIRNGGASIWWLQQIKVVSHGCWMTHDARVHSKAILVTWPGQLREKKKNIYIHFNKMFSCGTQKSGRGAFVIFNTIIVTIITDQLI